MDKEIKWKEHGLNHFKFLKQYYSKDKIIWNIFHKLCCGKKDIRFKNANKEDELNNNIFKNLSDKNKNERMSGTSCLFNYILHIIQKYKLW